jgi:peroxiredoxin
MRKIKTLRNPFIVLPLLAGVLLPCVVFAIFHFSRPATADAHLVLKDAVFISGQALPQTDLRELYGKSVDPTLLRKGKVLLVFFTTNCPACQKEMKLISETKSELAGKVRIYGVGVQGANDVTRFNEENGIQTSSLLDKDGQLMRSLSVKYFPAKFLIDDGEIVKTWFGNSIDRADLLTQLGF